MAHPCFSCGSECYCNGDIDDVIVCKTPAKCESCGCEQTSGASEYDDDQLCENCPQCGRTYDDIDFDFQICSKCGWDADNKKYGEKRSPSGEDYMNGDADIMTGEWR